VADVADELGPRPLQSPQYVASSTSTTTPPIDGGPLAARRSTIGATAVASSRCRAGDDWADRKTWRCGRPLSIARATI